MADIGEKLRLARVEAGLTVREAAEASGRSKDSISKIERGVQVPTALTVGKLARAYGVSPAEFLMDIPRKKVSAPPPGQRSFENHLAEERRAYETTRESAHLKDRIRGNLERWQRVARGEEDPNHVPDHAYAIEVYQHVIDLTDWCGKLIRVIKNELPPEAAISEQREIVSLIDQMGAVAAEINTTADAAEGITREAVDDEAQALIDAEVQAIVAQQRPTDDVAQQRAERRRRRYEELREARHNAARHAAEVKRRAAGE